MIKQNEVYKIGRIGKPHGVNGELQMQFDDDVFDRVSADYLVLDIEGILVPFFIEDYRFRSDNVLLIKFSDIDTQERARELTGSDVFFPRKLAAKDECDNISWGQLVGFHIIDININKEIGVIVSVDNSTINTLFEVRTKNNKDILVPASDYLIQDIDATKQVIKMNLPEGILNL